MSRRVWHAESIAVLREHRFRRLFLAQAVSAVGDQAVPVVLAFAVLDRTGSAADLGAVLAAQLVPMVLIAPTSGVWADRFSRRNLLIGSHLARMASQGTLGALFVLDAAPVWAIAVLRAVAGAATAVARPAMRGLVAEVAPVDHRQRANALLTASAAAAAFVGPGLGGVLLATVGAGWGFVIDAASFAIAAGLVMRVRTSHELAPLRSNLLRDLRQGWDEVVSRRWVWLGIVNSGVAQLVWLSVLSVLGPLVAKRSLGGSSAWALISAAFGVGALLGTAAALYVRPRRPLVVAYALTTGCALTLFLLAGPAPVPLIALAELYAGVAVAMIGVLWETALQDHVPLTAYGRVAAYDLTGSLVLRPLGLAVVGPLAAWAGVGAVLVGAGVITAASSALLLLVPEVRELGSARQIATRAGEPRAGTASGAGGGKKRS